MTTTTTPIVGLLALGLSLGLGALGAPENEPAGQQLVYPANLAEKQFVEQLFERALRKNGLANASSGASRFSLKGLAGSKRGQEAAPSSTSTSTPTALPYVLNRQELFTEANGGGGGDDDGRKLDLIRQYMGLLLLGDESTEAPGETAATKPQGKAKQKDGATAAAQAATDCWSAATKRRLRDLQFLLEFHADQPASKLYEQLRELVLQRFARCKPLWDRQLVRAATFELSEQVTEKSRWLLDSLVTLGSYRDEPQARPYAASQLARVSADIPPAGLVLYLSRFDLSKCGRGGGGLVLDENMKNTTRLEWATFELAANRTLNPLCRPLCSKWAHQLDYYRLVGNPAGQQLARELDRRLLAGGPQQKQHQQDRHLTEQANEWLALTRVCCQLADARQRGPILERVYREIVAAPEVRKTRASAQELALSEKMAKLRR